MGAAAGAAVEARHLHNPHRPGQLLFAAIGYVRQLLRFGIPAFYRQIAPHCLVGLLFDFRQHLRGDYRVKIDDGALLAHMEAGVAAPKPPVENAGDNVLAGVLLHSDEPGLPVDVALHPAPRLQGPVTQVDDFLSPFPGVQHRGTAQFAGIRRLPAPLGVEGRGIQNNLKSLGPLLAGNHPGSEPLQVGIFIVKLSCGHNDILSEANCCLGYRIPTHPLAPPMGELAAP